LQQIPTIHDCDSPRVRDGLPMQAALASLRPFKKGNLRIRRSEYPTPILSASAGNVACWPLNEPARAGVNGRSGGSERLLSRRYWSANGHRSGQAIYESGLEKFRGADKAFDHSCDEIDRAGPCLIAVSLRYANINRQVGAARGRHCVTKGDAAAPVRFRQAIDAQQPSKSTAIENDFIVGQRREIHFAGNDIRFDVERAAAGIVEPQVNACKIARCHRCP
jgi:hypothetical protein